MSLDLRSQLRRLRNTRPRTPEALYHWAWLHTGIRLARNAVCCGHHAPLDALYTWQVLRPPISLCLGARGSGKAQPLDSMVQTPSGPRRMGDIRVGDEVCTPYGTTGTVLAVHPQGIKPIYRVEFRDGDHVLCCGDHLWEVDRRGSNKRVERVVIDTREMQATCRYGKRQDTVYSIPLPAPLEMHDRGGRGIDPYIMGVLLGDGCFRASMVTFTSADAELVSRVADRCPDGYSPKSYGGCTYAISKGTQYGPRYNPVKREIVRLGLDFAGSFEKFIPDTYLYAPTDVRLELLRGLMDTDGHAGAAGHTVEFCTVSPTMARQVKWLVESLGGMARPIWVKTTHQDACRIFIRFADARPIFGLGRKSDRVRPKTKYIPKRIVTAVREVGESECQCITVDSPGGLYLTDHCIVTHNSFCTAIDTHLDSRFLPDHMTRILGGSQSQSRQVYIGISEAILKGVGPAPWHSTDRDEIAQLGVERAVYKNGSEVEILTASPLSVRGPHIPSLRMDEVDEIDTDIRESAMGMCMAKRGYSAKLTMTSTWHNLGGPMSGLIERAKEGRWPFHIFCLFEVLERCPESRSGPFVGGADAYERCPECPLRPWCHAERDKNGDIPLAKIADGHYAIDSAIQKVQTVSRRTFDADYLCRGPRADGVWFPHFDPARNVTEDAEYDPNHPVFFGLDTGARTGGVWLQVRQWVDANQVRQSRVNIFGECYYEHLTPEMIVHGVRGRPDLPETRGIFELDQEYCRGRIFARYTDPAGKAWNQAGSILIGDYANAGMSLQPWPLVGVVNALRLVEDLIASADGTVRLTIHPRCVRTIQAFLSYRRAKVGAVYVDRPAEPQHPHENLIDPIKNTLVAVIGPEGHQPLPNLRRVHASHLL